MQEVSNKPQTEESGGRHKAFLAASVITVVGAVYWLNEFEQSKAAYRKKMETPSFSKEVTNALSERFQAHDLGWKTKQELAVVGGWLVMALYFWWASGLLRKGRKTNSRPVTFWLGSVVFAFAVAVVVELIS